jgi:hypothetical protein
MASLQAEDEELQLQAVSHKDRTQLQTDHAILLLLPGAHKGVAQD